MSSGVRPECCCHPDCFQCPYPDCKYNGTLAGERVDVNMTDGISREEYIRRKNEKRNGWKKDCSYPNCSECQYEDCIVDNVNALLKRRRYNANPEAYRQKQRDYRSRVAESLPHCDECNECTLVKLDKGTGFKRLCVLEMRLILQKVTCCPQWCPKKIPVKEREHQRYLRKKELKAGEKTDTN